MLRASVPMSGPKVSGSVRIFWYILSVTSEVDVNSKKHSYRDGADHRRKVGDQKASHTKVRQGSTSQLPCLKRMIRKLHNK